MISKLVSIDKALDAIYDGCSLMYGGFGGIGNPPTLIKGILERNISNLTLIGNDAGFPDIGIGPVIVEKRGKKLITSHIGSNPIAGKLMNAGELEVEFSPQGTLVERIRAGGIGLGGVFVDIGEGTIVEKDKEKIELNGKTYFVEPALTANVSIVYAKKADPFGNLVYDKSARNTNPIVAMAGDITIAEVDEFVELGELNPEEIVTPGIFVDMIVISKGVNWKWVWEKM
ncbi:CoA transferase subunit A [Bacillus sp. FJAT-45350]|uniref:CoA transferase subunit A n=1 Tax=Bacillus sp. FJAT-45350 TaxID=2011014 RepID=UPI000BB804C8|nr:CoA transferase subunit A [Bacillus sp. FJAT-45350]